MFRFWIQKIFIREQSLGANRNENPHSSGHECSDTDEEEEAQEFHDANEDIEPTHPNRLEVVARTAILEDAETENLQGELVIIKPRRPESNTASTLRKTRRSTRDAGPRRAVQLNDHVDGRYSYCIRSPRTPTLEAQTSFKSTTSDDATSRSDAGTYICTPSVPTSKGRMAKKPRELSMVRQLKKRPNYCSWFKSRLHISDPNYAKEERLHHYKYELVSITDHASNSRRRSTRNKRFKHHSSASRASRSALMVAERI